MPVSRRSLIATSALPLVLIAALAACTSEGPREAAPAPDEVATPAPEWNTSPDSVAAIGDSITRAFDACSLLSDCPEASWVTGTDTAVSSLAQQLLGEATAERSWNLAATGARVADLPAQAAEAVRHEPELVTVLIGANDACAADVASMTSPTEFRAALTEAFGVIREELPETGIYVSSVPDLMRLWEEGSESFMARTVWQMANICPSMLSDASDDGVSAGERRAEVRARVQEYNTVLEDVCTADELCRYDGGAVFDFRFTPSHLSDWDWFHPSREGQSELAALAYEQITTDQPAEPVAPRVD
ncbi:SGNH/GDSL hydrolase family protein [Streptomyces sp. 8K308]|uniref:SGNH/GDSL hydrolase family protein n=1 Tax=Streptomyces sp. 8K308 TaxID=2530388 RepID=UPI001A9FF880|nr:SGNH/GDSL hydrolase family protein [Streptomyces sp. 8K308]